MAAMAKARVSKRVVKERIMGKSPWDLGRQSVSIA
jgi:hypothetical protein